MVGVRARKAWADLLEQNHFGAYVHLFSFGQAIPPVSKLDCKLDLPFH